MLIEAFKHYTNLPFDPLVVTDADTVRRLPTLAANGLLCSLPSGICPAELLCKEFGAEFGFCFCKLLFNFTFRNPFRVTRRLDMGVINVIGS